MDQIILEVPMNHFRIPDPRVFEPEFYPVRQGYFEYKTYKGKLRPKGYYPQLTINGRPNRKLGYQHVLKIQVSVPKLLYGNNLSMVNVEDEERFYYILKTKCLELGVEILTDIKNLKVIGFDSSLNVYLSPGATAEQAIRYLYRGYTPKSVSFDHRDFRDKGHAIYLHTGKWNFVIYDKKADLAKAQYMRIDKSKQGITKERHDNLAEQQNKRLRDIDVELSKLTSSQETFYLTAETVLNLVSRAKELFEMATTSEKQNILKLILYNSETDGKEYSLRLKEPFDLIFNFSERSSWQGYQESNPDRRFWRPLFYH